MEEKRFESKFKIKPKISVDSGMYGITLKLEMK